jgi:hypothetical protein
MSRAREPFHHLRETLREALRREDEEVRPDQRAGAPSQWHDDAGPREGPEVPDTPLGVAGTDGLDGPSELPGFPQTDPSQG